MSPCISYGDMNQPMLVFLTLRVFFFQMLSHPNLFAVTPTGPVFSPKKSHATKLLHPATALSGLARRLGQTPRGGKSSDHQLILLMVQKSCSTCKKNCKYWGKVPTSTGERRISSINSMENLPFVYRDF